MNGSNTANTANENDHSPVSKVASTTQSGPTIPPENIFLFWPNIIGMQYTSVVDQDHAQYDHKFP